MLECFQVFLRCLVSPYCHNVFQKAPSSCLFRNTRRVSSDTKQPLNKQLLPLGDLMVPMWSAPWKTVSPKRGSFCALKEGSQKVKADCRPSLVVTPISRRKTTPVLEPFPGIYKNKHNLPLRYNPRKTLTQKHPTTSLKNT